MAWETYPHYDKILLCTSSNVIDQWRLKDMPNTQKSFPSDNKKQHFKVLARWRICLTGTLSSLKTSSCKPQALLMFNIMKYVFTQFHKILFDGILFFYTCSQEIVNSFPHFHCRPPRVKFAALIEKLPLHYIQLWDTTQTWWRAEKKRGNQKLELNLVSWLTFTELSS